MRNIINNTLKEYDISGKEYIKISSKTAKITCSGGNCFFLKETDYTTEEKIRYLNNSGVNNVLYPIQNKKGNFITKSNNKVYYITPFFENKDQIEPLKFNKLKHELELLHESTTYRKELSPSESRKKLEEIFNYLRYKFDAIESLVRSVENKPFDEFSILILKEYHNILDAKVVLANLNKKIVEHVKSRKSVDYSFVHNNPKLDHLVSDNINNYLISIENSKIGIPSLDLVKLYIECEDITINKKELFIDYFNKYSDDFYLDYFCFFVIVYYIKGIITDGKDYVTSQSFVHASRELTKFMNDFNLKTKIN